MLAHPSELRASMYPKSGFVWSTRGRITSPATSLRVSQRPYVVVGSTGAPFILVIGASYQHKNRDLAMRAGGRFGPWGTRISSLWLG